MKEWRLRYSYDCLMLRSPPPAKKQTLTVYPEFFKSCLTAHLDDGRARRVADALVLLDGARLRATADVAARGRDHLESRVRHAAPGPTNAAGLARRSAPSQEARLDPGQSLVLVDRAYALFSNWQLTGNSRNRRSRSRS